MWALFLLPLLLGSEPHFSVRLQHRVSEGNEVVRSPAGHLYVSRTFTGKVETTVLRKRVGEGRQT